MEPTGDAQGRSGSIFCIFCALVFGVVILRALGFRWEGLAAEGGFSGGGGLRLEVMQSFGFLVQRPHAATFERSAADLY